MPLRRHFKTIAAAALVAVALPASATAAERSMTVGLPSTITAEEIFPFTFSGDTGEGMALRIARVSFYHGDAPCPDPDAMGPDSVVNIAHPSQSIGISHAGGFAGGGRGYFDEPGIIRLCASIGTATNGPVIVGASGFDYEPAFTTTFTVGPSDGEYGYELPTQKPGTYKAGPAEIVGGAPNSSISFVVKPGGTVSSVSAKGIPAAQCRPGTAPRPVPKRFLSSKAAYGRNEFIGNIADVDFKTAKSNGAIEMVGSTETSLSGVFAAASKYHECRAGFGFTAKRVSSRSTVLR